MSYTEIDGYTLIDYLPIGRTIFKFYIPATSKCDNIRVPQNSGIEINAWGFDYFLEDVLECHDGKVNLRIEEKINGKYSEVIYAKDCKVTTKDSGGLLIPYSVKKWFEDTFIYSYVKYASKPDNKKALEYKKEMVQDNVLKIKKGEKNQCKYPMEIVEVLYSEARNCVIIRPFKVIKPENINSKDYPIFLEYLKKNLDVIERRNQQRLNGSASTDDGFSFIDVSQDWKNGESYEKVGGEIKNSPGIYSLYKTLNGGGISIYTGKADVMCNRIVGNKENGKWTVGHPKTDPLYKAFDEVRFDTLNFESFLAAVEKTNTDEEKNAFQEKMLNAIAETAWSIVGKLLDKTNQSYEIETGFNGKASGSPDTASETILETCNNPVTILNYLFDNMVVLRLSDRLEAPEKLNQKISFLGVCSKWMTGEEYRQSGDVIKSANAMYVVQRPDGQQPKLIFSRSYDPQPNDIVRLDIIDLSPLMDMIELFKKKIQNAKNDREKNSAKAKLYQAVLYALEGVVNHLVKTVFYKNPKVEIANTQYDSASKNAFL